MELVGSTQSLDCCDACITEAAVGQEMDAVKVLELCRVHYPVCSEEQPLSRKQFMTETVQGVMKSLAGALEPVESRQLHNMVLVEAFKSFRSLMWPAVPFLQLTEKQQTKQQRKEKKFKKVQARKEKSSQRKLGVSDRGVECFSSETKEEKNELGPGFLLSCISARNDSASLEFSGFLQRCGLGSVTALPGCANSLVFVAHDSSSTGDNSSNDACNSISLPPPSAADPLLSPTAPTASTTAGTVHNTLELLYKNMKTMDTGADSGASFKYVCSVCPVQLTCEAKSVASLCFQTLQTRECMFYVFF